jgi:hypothetical protein
MTSVHGVKSLRNGRHTYFFVDIRELILLGRRQRWMTTSHTMPELRSAIIDGLNHWRDPSLARPISSVLDMRLAVDLQDSLGWYQFSMGQVGYRWKGIQQQYLEFIARHNTGRKWVRELIKKPWAVAGDMWEHRNNILHSTIMPAKLRKLAQLDLRIRYQFSLGIDGLLLHDLHWLSELVKVLKYDIDVKGQWLASIELARERYDA